MSSITVTLRRAMFVALVSTLTLASTANATHLVVDPSGGGDFTTLQAGLDSLATYQYVTPTMVDSLVVLPGDYVEDITLPGWYWGEHPLTIWARGGRDSTRVLGRFEPREGAEDAVHVIGFSFTRRVVDYGRVRWNACRFDSGYAMGVYATHAPNLHGCEFRGAVELLNYVGYPDGTSFDDLTFFDAQVTASNTLRAYVFFDRCRFVDAPGVAVRFTYTGDGYGPCGFRDCTFENCRDGIALTNVAGGKTNVVERCRFSNVPGTAIRAGDAWTSTWPQESISLGALTVNSCFFDHVGIGVDALAGDGMTMTADTVTGDSWSAVRARVTAARIRQLRVLGARGPGIDVRRIGLDQCLLGVEVSDCVVDGALWDGIVVRDSLPYLSVNDATIPDMVTGCTVSRCGGAGLRLDGVNVVASNNVAFANQGDGFAVTATPGLNAAGQPLSLTRNTSVRNRGDGIRLARTTNANAADIVQHNLVAFNGGTGMRTSAPSALVPASLAFNDAWANDAGAYSGLAASADSNLAAAPWFCDLAAGDLTLQVGSPCAPTGPFGAIGALGVACASTGGVAPEAQALAFAPWPNPARGAVTFALPPLASDARVEILDIAGRTLWRADVRAGTARVRFDGATINGPLAPGLYWARVVAPDLVQSRRLVWLR